MHPTTLKEALEDRRILLFAVNEAIHALTLECPLTASETLKRAVEKVEEL